MLEISRFPGRAARAKYSLFVKWGPPPLGGASLKNARAPIGADLGPTVPQARNQPGGLLCLRRLPGLICLLRLLCLLHCLSLYVAHSSTVAAVLIFLALLTLLALVSLLAFLMCLGPRILTSLS